MSLEKQWYWDSRTNKAFYPVDSDECSTTFLTVRHDEEIAEARDAGVFLPLDDTELTRSGATFDRIESFRLPEEIPDMEED